MSHYDYTSLHDLKDIAMIYNDQDWDNAKIVVWNPIEQKLMNICFTGSSKSNNPNKPNVINFNVWYQDEKYHRWKWRWSLFKNVTLWKLKKWFHLTK